jgi:hypothetical protein
MGGRIVGPDVGLDLDDASAEEPASTPAHQDLPEEPRRRLDRRQRQEREQTLPFAR